MNKRLTDFRQLLKDNQLQGALVRSTDCYLNEYVPAEQSRRVYLTGFTGSIGDVLVSADKAILFVDGRYSIQAKKEATDFEVRILPLGQSIESAWLTELETWKDFKIGVESDRISVNLYQKLKGYNLAELPAFGPAPAAMGAHKTWAVPEKITGENTEQRL